MELDVIEQRVKIALPDATVEAKGDGYHFELIVVSDSFSGQGLLARQRKIMALFKNEISDGSLHALSIQAKTTHEWENRKK